MILPDVNALVYAFHRDSAEHDLYGQWIESLLKGSEPLALADVVLTGFLRVVTNRRIFSNPAPVSLALSFVSVLRTSHLARPVRPTEAAWQQLAAFTDEDPYLAGNLIPDAWIAALAVTTGARLATADAGFARFGGLAWFNPMRGE